MNVKQCGNCTHVKCPADGCVGYFCTLGEFDVNKEDYCRMHDNQEIKQDAGKPRISLVPPAIIRAIAKIRGYGVAKYGDKESWREVGLERFHDAFLRHVVAAMNDPRAVDKESGYLHLEHAAANLDFILELMEGEDAKEV